MSGFIGTELNRQIAAGVLNNIIVKVLECIDLMLLDCSRGSLKIDNNETTICNYLYNNYLNNDAIMQHIEFDSFRFFSEVPENYVGNNPKGRIDLQVINIDEFRHRERYFIIECKRIDGNKTLNREYVNEGIRRFVETDPKYSSYYKMNCMLGFVVKKISVNDNVEKINELLLNDYSDIHVYQKLSIGATPCTYTSSHGLDKSERIVLSHVFAGCDSMIAEK